MQMMNMTPVSHGGNFGGGGNTIHPSSAVQQPQGGGMFVQLPNGQVRHCEERSDEHQEHSKLVENGFVTRRFAPRRDYDIYARNTSALVDSNAATT